jgi:general stress protein YciG
LTNGSILLFAPAMNEKIQRELQGRIEAFAADVTAVLQRAMVDAVNQALKGSAGKRGRVSGKSKVSDAELLKEIARKGGRRIEEIELSLGAARKSLAPGVKRLLAAKQIRRTGQARGTKYFAGK